MVKERRKTGYEVAKWDAEKLAKLEELWKQAKPNAVISEALGVSEKQIQFRAKQLKLEPRNFPKKVKVVHLVCQWLVSTDDEPYRVCGGELVPGKPWCAHHLAVLEKVNKRRDTQPAHIETTAQREIHARSLRSMEARGTLGRPLPQTEG